MGGGDVDRSEGETFLAGFVQVIDRLVGVFFTSARRLARSLER